MDYLGHSVQISKSDQLKKVIGQIFHEKEVVLETEEIQY